ncbi:MAG: tryptophan-rich sensory protein [Hyphomicrobiales bacterium]|nr:tryptophan-rich sensory protein [Hyphomicrobiales bacterium]MBV9589112.1 tryptophan-rich sensory protein [Hyphomicrobiales bacterium]MBV9976362.1 tryptophan-rich sensory protein [Hyphomicrobiales bacterium]
MTKIPMLSDAPAAERVREAEDVRDLEGVREFGQAPGLEVSRNPPRRMGAAAIAVICVAVTSVSSYVFTNPEMPRIDPVIEFPWFIPIGPAFGLIWVVLTLTVMGSFYLVLRSSPDNRLRRVAIAAYVAQLAMHTVWAWLLFARRLPMPSLCAVLLFVAVVIVAIWAAAHVDKRASLLLTPYLAWAIFALVVTARIATGVAI